jgi:hypothetical protein
MKSFQRNQVQQEQRIGVTIYARMQICFKCVIIFSLDDLTILKFNNSKMQWKSWAKLSATYYIGIPSLHIF